MADISIRKSSNGGQQQPQRQPQAQGLQPQNPLRLMRDLMHWDPFSELAPMLGMQSSHGVFAAFDVKETPDAYVFKADLPGFTEKDVEITAAGNRLTIAGVRRDEREEKGDTYYVAERRHGTFNRSFTLPQGVDVEHVNAELKQGVLTVTVPRVSAQMAKKISVKSSSTQGAGNKQS